MLAIERSCPSKVSRLKTSFPSPNDRLKRETLIALLDDGMVMVHLDTRRDGVDVPEQHRGHPALALNFSRAFRLDVFEVGPFEVVASLSFQGEVYRCVVPYGAIFSMTSKVDGQSRIFSDALPPELEAMAESIETEPDAASERGGAEVIDDDVPPTPESTESAPTAPFLRLVD